MKICKTKQELGAVLGSLESANVGLVPTMGALHKGHISLVNRARKENDIVVVSVFVNPIQFNNPNDLKNYPRNAQADLDLLQQHECDIVFMPTEEEIYPKGEKVEHYDFGAIERVMEGKQRPGHFNGVGVIVGRLFNMVKPTRAYFGEKDFQQVAIIQELVKQTNSPVQIVPCPIVREADGLALSSRNQLLSTEQRNAAPFIYQSLLASEKTSKNASVQEVIDFVKQQIGSRQDMELEYFEIVNAQSLQNIQEWKQAKEQVGCIVVHMGSVRLIDNIRYHII